MVGAAETATHEVNPFLWSTAGMIDLGTLGGRFGQAFDISPPGQVVGAATLPSGQLHAFLWDQEVMTDLGYQTWLMGLARCPQAYCPPGMSCLQALNDQSGELL